MFNNIYSKILKYNWLMLLIRYLYSFSTSISILINGFLIEIIFAMTLHRQEILSRQRLCRCMLGYVV